MVEIRIYIEGGGDRKNTREKLQEGFAKFFAEVLTTNKPKIIMCGPRREAYEKFLEALQDHPNAFNVLLVDAEEAVKQGKTPIAHLRERKGDEWDLTGVAEEQIHLMVQVMESWFLADKVALQKFYGQGFNLNALPKVRNVEQIAKADLERALDEATRKTQKGEYH